MKTINNLRKTKEQKKNLYGWLFVAPFIIGTVLVFIPILKDSFLFSLNEININPTNGVERLFVGWSNYNYALRIDPEFIKNIYMNIGIMLNNIPTIIIFSLFIATILDSKIRGRTFFRAIFFLPVILTTGIIAKADSMSSLLTEVSGMQGIATGAGEKASQGLISINEIQSLLNDFIFAPQIASIVISAVNNISWVITNSGVQMLIFLAGLQSIDKSVYEAAYIEGATGWECFWKLTFPMISPMIFVNVIYTIIDSLTNSTNGIMEIISDTAFKQSQYGIASAMAWIYFVVISICIIIISAIINRYIYYRE